MPHNVCWISFLSDIDIINLAVFPIITGDEMGMLEDFAVGIHDLHSVTFKIKENSTEDASMMPELSGTR